MKYAKTKHANWCKSKNSRLYAPRQMRSVLEENALKMCVLRSSRESATRYYVPLEGRTTLNTRPIGLHAKKALFKVLFHHFPAR